MPVWLFFSAPKDTNKVLSTMDVVFNGQPFVFVPAKRDISLGTLDFTNQGQPFVSYARE